MSIGKTKVKSHSSSGFYDKKRSNGKELVTMTKLGTSNDLKTITNLWSMMEEKFGSAEVMLDCHQADSCRCWLYDSS